VITACGKTPPEAVETMGQLITMWDRSTLISPVSTSR